MFYLLFSTHRILSTPIYVIVWIMSSISNVVLSLHRNSSSHWSPFSDASGVSFYIFFFQSLVIIFASGFFICLRFFNKTVNFFGLLSFCYQVQLELIQGKRPMLVYYQQLECGAQDPSSTVADNTTSTLLL